MSEEAGRQIYEDQQALLPEMPMFGYSRRRSATDRLGPHTHEDCYELCLIVRGQVEWWVGNDVYLVGSGQMYITYPGEEHGGVGSIMHPCDLYWLHVRLSDEIALPGLSLSQTRQIDRALRGFASRTFDTSDTTRRCYEQMADHLHRGEPLAPVALRASLHTLLMSVMDDHAAAVEAGTARRPSEPMQVALEWMARHLEEDFRMSDVAAVVGLSVNHFQSRFRKEVGLTPGDYLVRQRVGRARQLLTTSDRSITDIALSLGFSSSQYFATVFRRLVGRTPSAYRGAARPG